jgi:class 3 adenylate cyclase
MLTLAQYQDAAAQALKQGAPLVAFDTGAEGLRHFPDDPRLRQLLALALARSGASRDANQLLHALVRDGHTDEETVGTLARTYKDLWAGSRDATSRRRHLEQAFHWYLEAHRQSGGYWSAINAATMASLLDEGEQSRRLAQRVRDQCLGFAKRPADCPDGYWRLATLGEAALLLGDRPAAEAWYREAVGLGLHGVADLVSTRRNARLILQHAQIDPSAIDACFPIPRVAVFAGHLIDRPGRPAPRFPPSCEQAVEREILARLRRHDIGIGYASAGAGGDILFLEGLLAIGAEPHVVLPYNLAQFLEDSVDYIPESTWAARCRTVIERAERVTTASEQRMLVGSMAYEFGFLLLDGQAAVHAAELETELVCLAVWDGQPGDGPGGTAASVAHWRQAHRHVEIIDLRALGAEPPPVMIATNPGAASAGAEASVSGFDAQLVGLLFADVHGFSKLSEEQIPLFVDHYLRRIADTLAEFEEPPLLTNTWGDGLYLVFRTVSLTGRFALRLSEVLRATDWTAHGLPDTLGLRMAVHAGPAYACLDPITSRLNYLGAHVALAARIEPVTPAGQVYGSGAFAALAKACQVREFECAYVGQTPLAKAYGVIPMYVLRSTA